MLLLLHFIIIFFKPIISILSLNFYRNLTKILSPDNLMENLYSNDIFTFLEIGTPKQKISMNIKLQTYAFYFLSDESKSNLINFSPKKSKTFYSSNILSSYIINEDFHRAFFSSDIISLSDINKNNNFTFLLVKDISSEIYEGGGIGLNLKTKSPNIENISFIYQLKKHNLISSYTFTIKYKNENEGNLIIGKRPDEYDNQSYKNEYFKYTNIPSHNEEFDWGLYFDKIEYDNISFDKIKNYVYFEIELGVIISNSNYKKFIENQFFNKFFIENKCFLGKFSLEKTKDTEFQYFYCDEDVDISTIKNLNFFSKELNYTFEFNYKDLFYNFKGKNYYLIIFPWYRSLNWRIGFPFFKKYQLVFDSEKKIVGLYEIILEKKFKFKNWNNYLIIILFIIIIFLIIYISNSQFNKKRKIRANELEDKYEYINQDIEHKIN